MGRTLVPFWSLHLITVIKPAWMSLWGASFLLVRAEVGNAAWQITITWSHSGIRNVMLQLLGVSVLRCDFCMRTGHIDPCNIFLEAAVLILLRCHFFTRQASCPQGNR